MDKRSAAKAGKAIEFLGSYNPRQKTASFKEDRIKYWLSVGAKASASLHNLLISKNIIQGAKIDVSAKSKKKEEKTSAETPAESKIEAPAEAAAEKTEEKVEEKSETE